MEFRRGNGKGESDGIRDRGHGWWAGRLHCRGAAGPPGRARETAGACPFPALPHRGIRGDVLPVHHRVGRRAGEGGRTRLSGQGRPVAALGRRARLGRRLARDLRHQRPDLLAGRPRGLRRRPAAPRRVPGRRGRRGGPGPQGALRGRPRGGRRVDPRGPGAHHPRRPRDRRDRPGGLLSVRHLDNRTPHDVFRNVAVWGYYQGGTLLPRTPAAASTSSPPPRAGTGSSRSRTTCTASAS